MYIQKKEMLCDNLSLTVPQEEKIRLSKMEAQEKMKLLVRTVYIPNAQMLKRELMFVDRQIENFSNSNDNIPFTFMERKRILKEMLKETIDVMNILNNYYDRSFHLPTEYTLNNR